jgi:hypothetical protein
MTKQAYAHVTYDFTMAAAQTLARRDPRMTFIYVSGAGTDSTEKGRSRWARVKGKTESALLRLPFRAAYMLRPGIFQPLCDVRSRRGSYRVLYSLTKPLLPLLHRTFPKYILTIAEIDRLILLIAKRVYPKQILETTDRRVALSAGWR